MNWRYHRYGNGPDISHQEILEVQRAEGSLFARGEDSGCESSYVEIARWNEQAFQWQRFAFAKTLDFDRTPEDLNDEELADVLAKEINDASWEGGRQGVIHSLPNYEEVPVA